MDRPDGFGVILPGAGEGGGHTHGAEPDAADVQLPQVYVLHRYCSLLRVEEFEAGQGPGPDNGRPPAAADPVEDQDLAGLSRATTFHDHVRRPQGDGDPRSAWSDGNRRDGGLRRARLASRRLPTTATPAKTRRGRVIKIAAKAPPARPESDSAPTCIDWLFPIARP